METVVHGVQPPEDVEVDVEADMLSWLRGIALKAFVQ